MTAPTSGGAVIIGGGFSGAAVAWHLAQLRPDLRRIQIVEPRPALGCGLAYSAKDPSHRINVPAARMSLMPDKPEHFNDWLLASGRLEADPAARLADGRNFPSRRVFGEYVSGELAQLGDRIDHVAATAKALEAAPSGYKVRLDDGRTLCASVVVLAVCHLPPAIPQNLRRALGDYPRFLPNPWADNALKPLRPDDRVLIIGSGLTMADIVATLDRQGHRGTIVAISRRGQLSRGHAAVPNEPYGDFAAAPAVTLVKLLRRIRRTIAEAAREGISWHAVLDQVRLQGTIIWRALPLVEQKRLLRHLRPFWDTHRFRVAPQIERLLQQRRRDGSFEVRAASIMSVERAGEQINVVLRDRRNGRLETTRFDAVLLATGPAHGRVFADNPLLASLASAGLARADPLALGIEVDLQARAVGANGQIREDLFVAGPLARGTFGELMGLPDVANHALRVARGVAGRLAASDPLSGAEAQRHGTFSR
jgi:uncharacterized NAD(P)/FAD-binding protein YdhS